MNLPPQVINEIQMKTENGGDLTLVTHDIAIPRLKPLDPRTREGEHMVKLRALMKRIDKLVDSHTETKVRQPISHYPLV